MYYLNLTNYFNCICEDGIFNLLYHTDEVVKIRKNLYVKVDEALMKKLIQDLGDWEVFSFLANKTSVKLDGKINQYLSDKGDKDPYHWIQGEWYHDICTNLTRTRQTKAAFEIAVAAKIIKPLPNRK